ncbi:hypothetical protein PUN28_017486 [Cardiocondyla obscurior]|uniref:Uncharacterized protein n=1 Tax=Cardiocondyla obscurior TaxID=286306 RepID=A0AAW2ELF7_9HYME
MTRRQSSRSFSLAPTSSLQVRSSVGYADIVSSKGLSSAHLEATRVATNALRIMRDFTRDFNNVWSIFFNFFIYLIIYFFFLNLTKDVQLFRDVQPREKRREKRKKKKEKKNKNKFEDVL